MQSCRGTKPVCARPLFRHSNHRKIIMSIVRKLWSWKGEVEQQSSNEGLKKTERLTATLTLGPRVVNPGQIDAVIE